LQANINTDLEDLPVNQALLQLVVGVTGENTEWEEFVPKKLTPEERALYLQSSKCIQELALYLKPFSSGKFRANETNESFLKSKYST